MILVKYSNQGNLKPYFYFALEEYIMKYLLKDNQAYFFTWIIKGIVIGKHQVLESEVNLDYVKDNQIEVFRRPTGGGTVYADENNTMFSMITKRTENFSFKPYLKLIIQAIEKLGLKLEFSGRNDLLFAGKKISGVAFLQNKYGFLIHGTFLYDVDINKMVRSITPNNEKLVHKGINSVSSRVLNLKNYLNGLSLNDLIVHLEKEITTKVYELSKEEEQLINQMAKKYESKAWRFQKQPPFTKTVSKRILGGSFNITLDVKEGLIENMKISGDFFDLLPVSIIEESFKKVKYEKSEVKRILQNIAIENIIIDIDKNEFEELLLSAISK